MLLFRSSQSHRPSPDIIMEARLYYPAMWAKDSCADRDRSRAGCPNCGITPSISNKCYLAHALPRRKTAFLLVTETCINETFTIR